jgi:NitT/TauT family transport system ATP-binding protein
VAQALEAMSIAADSRTAAALTVADVNLVYGEEVEALRGINLSIRDGEFVSIVGPSGCGKSSLLKLVLGLEKATSGEITISGRVVTGPNRDVGVVFQSPVLLPWRTVRENVLLPADVQRLGRASVSERATRLLNFAGLGGFEERYPFELSGGMQQRVAIVRALIHDPRLLLMDEPFAALDAITREQISMELQRIWMQSRKTVVFITHSIQEAVLLSDRIAVMSARPGRIISVLDNPAPRPRKINDLVAPDMAKLAEIIRDGLEITSTE